MKIIKTKIEDLVILEPEIFTDDRGWFFELYNKNKLESMGINVNFIQDNQSFTKNKGTLRGMHLQNYPFTQSKLVRCTKGSILDVAVDLRKNSKTYKQWVSVELTEENKRQFFIPRGFAHGFLTLTDNVIFEYKVDNCYNKESEIAFRFNDKEINIDWSIDNPILIDRDSKAPFLKDCNINLIDN